MFKKITIYVVRISPKGLKDSAPCVDCTNKMKQLGIKKVIYSNAEGGITLCKLKDYETTKKTRSRKRLCN